ncbi:putative formaldehyde dehydrogenase AdhA [Colletotrichum spaethianum]|uniref:Amine oxidase n=1 Tax=Colletotrichum spaethianum TaxID=700344 RepID=A0AA37P6R2_9PEZI|nr:putative formaldehyde dehydrogenase AdhA [Colletotrichum spaethianum]GKT40294.1 putative formaldehyde dehydrogenase AdhA [Colletotrichum spaethianum]
MNFVTAVVGLLTLIMPVFGLDTSMDEVLGQASKSLTTPVSEPTYDRATIETMPVPLVAEKDVIIVGGGFSGVMAAYDVSQAGYKTLLLEARHRIGGRSQTQALQSAPEKTVEMGATWINKITQPFIYALCEQFGLETAEQYTTGDVIRQDFSGTIHRESQDLNQFPEGEDVALADWIAQKGLWDKPEVRAAAESMTSAIVGRMPQEVGAHYFLDYVQSGKGLLSLSTEGIFGAQSLKIKKGIGFFAACFGMPLLTHIGTSALTDALVSTMDKGSVTVNNPVNRIVQLGDGEVLVTTSQGQSYKSKKVIIAIPSNTYSNIHFTPPLPPFKRGLSTRTMPGIYAKVILNYSRPWWRDSGLVGKFSSEVGPICFSWDTSDLETEQYSLALFVAGSIAAAWHELTDLGREDAIIEHLATLVGSDLAAEARNVSEYNVLEWTKEEYLWGGPTSSMGPGMLRKYGTSLRESFGDLHFGGGETAYAWKGYLEGAITSGKRAAKEVIDALQSDR